MLLICATTMVSAAQPKANNSFKVADKSQFDAAMQRVAPGDEIVLANGEWRDMELAITTSGTAQDKIYIRGEQPDKVIIGGASQIKIGADHIHLYNLTFNGCVATSPTRKGHIVDFQHNRREANYSTISDCSFDACVPDDKSYDDVWINLYGTHNTVEHCYMGNKDNKGLYIVVWHKNAKADHHTIRNNYFYRPKSHNREENGQEAIRIGDSSNSLTNSSTRVENNFFYRCNGEIEIISIKSGDNTIHGNTFLECVGCVTLRHGNNNTISQNLFLANNTPRAGGVRVINRGHRIFDNYFYGQISGNERAAISIQLGIENGALNEYDPVVDVEISRNTMVECSENFSFGVGSRGTVVARDVTLSQNLVVTSRTSTSRLIDDNNTDTSGIGFEESHLEGRDGALTGSGFIAATYERSTISVAGVEIPQVLVDPILATQPTIGAPKIDLDQIATPSNCGPRWSGWLRPY